MFDLNLLRVLAAVVEEKTVTAAAHRLELTQPAITHSINRLRRLTQDELFVKHGRGIVPTRAALQLYRDTVGPVRDAEAAMATVARFDPLTTTATFRIALTDIGQLTFLPPLVEALRERAPQAWLEVRSLDASKATEHIITGELDVAVQSSPLGEAVRSELLRYDRYVCIARRGTFPGTQLSLEEVMQQPRVVTPASTGHTLIEETLGEPPAGSVELSSFSPIPGLIERTDLVAFAPGVLVDLWVQEWDIGQWSLPEADATVEVRAFLPYTPVSAASAWFGKLTVKTLSNDQWDL